MSKLNESIQLIANLIIICAAVIVIGVVVQRYFLTAPTANMQARLQPTVGLKMTAPDINFSQQSKTLILALQIGCHFCNESAPFYKRIIESVKDKNVKLVAVFPGKVEDGEKHLADLGLTNMEVKQSSLNSLQVSGTPTLILTNDKGEIIDSWIGKLPPDKEKEVINRLNS